MMMMSTIKLEIITSNVITLFFRVKKKDTNTEDSEKVGPQNLKKKDDPNKRNRYY